MTCRADVAQYQGPMGRLRQLLPQRHIRWKIMGPYALLALALAFSGTYVVTNLMTGSLEERFTNQLAEAARATADSLVRRERQHLEVLRAITFTEGVAAAAAAGDTAQLERLVTPLAANSGTEFVEVLDGGGRQIIAFRLVDPAALTYALLSEGSSRASWPLVQKVVEGQADEQGDKFADIVSTADGPIIYTAGPLRAGDDIVGIVLVGSHLNSFLTEAKATAFADVTVYGEDLQPIASTFAVGQDRDSEETLSPQSTQASAVAGLRERHELFGREFSLLYGDLMIRGERLGSYSVALPTSFVTDANATARVQLGALFALATVAMLLIGWLLARVITSPLFKLLRTAQAVSGGDLTARSGVRSGDEIGALAAAFDTMTEKLQRQHLGTLEALVSAIDARDPYTRGHSVRVGHLSVDLGEALGLSTSQLQHLQIGGYLHDIGKIGIRDAVLLKPGKLTDEEFDLIRQHPTIGLDILRTLDLPPAVIAVVGGHHEKLNGAGYPLGLSAEELTIFPRIASVADIYDALTTSRPYRESMSVEQAQKLLERESVEGLLDPNVVAVMLKVAPRWEDRRKSEPMLDGVDFSQSLRPPDARAAS